MRNLVECIKTNGSTQQNETVIKLPEIPKKTAVRKTSKTKSSLEGFDSNVTPGLSVTGKEDFDTVMEHLKQQKIMPRNYKTKAQLYLDSIQLEDSENMMTQKTLDFTIENNSTEKKK